MSQRRTFWEIAAVILEYCLQPKTQTAILKHCNLNTKSVKDYISRLSEASLLTLRSSDTIYQTSSKGIEFLDRYYELAKKYLASELIDES